MRALILFALLAGYLWTDNAHADEPLIEWAPVFTVAADWTINSDIWLEPGCNDIAGLNVCQGRDPWADLFLGAEFAHRDWREHWYIPVFQLGVRHRSHWRDGGPWNDRPESWAEYISLEFRLGGLR